MGHGPFDIFSSCDTAVNTKTCTARKPARSTIPSLSGINQSFLALRQRMGENMKRLFAAVSVLSLIVFTNSFAQTTNATLGGTVSDSTGALIPGVTVTATNTQTGIVANVVTNETGAYQFSSLQTGVYKVTSELPGFQTQTYNTVTLGVGQQVRLNFTLQV